MLTIYKAGNAQFSANITENDTAEFLEECALQYETLLSPRGIEIEIDCEDDLVGFFDRDLVAGVINNVVNNAYRYSKDRIKMSAREDDGYIVISVADNGAGYPESMLFDSSAVSGSVSFSSGSTGLGLYFSSLVAEAHKNKEKRGYINCSNDGIDGGGCFSIYIP